MSSGLHALTREPRGRRRLLVIGLVVALIAALSVWRFTDVGRGDSAADDGCPESEPVRIAASPAIAPMLKDATAAMGELAGWCSTYTIEAKDPDEVIRSLVNRGPAAPDLWVPDSSTWQNQLAAQGVPAQTVTEALAASPVVLVGGPSADRPESWAAAMQRGTVEIPDPVVSGVGALALLSPRAEQSESGLTDQEIQGLLVPMAQRQGERRTTGNLEPVDLSSVNTTSATLIPASEQEFLQARRQNPGLTAVVPRTGTLMETFPMIAPTSTEFSKVGSGRELNSFLNSQTGRKLLAEHNFRLPTGDRLEGGIGVGSVNRLNLPGQFALEGDLKLWQVLSVPSSILAVFDASGSMNFPAPGGGTRAQLAVQAAITALEQFPEHARLGLWAFSVGLGGQGKDYRELVPLRQLSDKVGNGTQKQELIRWSNRFDSLLGGGTGLYDTTLAAYRDAQRDYDDRYFNSVVILSDGANDDPGSLRLQDLLKTLRDQADPSRPVKIIPIGISEDADMPSLRKIAEATNSKAYQAIDPRDILDVFAQALISR